MKTNKLWLIIVLITGLNSCQKDENDKIKYPETGNFGENILNSNSTDIQGTPYSSSNNPYYYSMCAEIPAGISVVIYMKKITSTGTTTWAFESSTRVGWSISNYEPGEKDLWRPDPFIAILKYAFLKQDLPIWKSMKMEVKHLPG